MADEDGETSTNQKTIAYNRPQETFQRGQEAQVEHRFPANTPGIVPLPRGSKGPRSLYLRRDGNSFGFTLRHFIVYPPDTINEHQDGRHAMVGALHEPIDTIFVKHVKENSPAKLAGLQKGDQLIYVNNQDIKNKTYSQVVQLIANSPEYLHLLVLPKEEDLVQRLFWDTAYNPASNQPTYPEPVDRQTAQQVISQKLHARPFEYRADHHAWQNLLQQLAYYQQPYPEFYVNRHSSFNTGRSRSRPAPPLQLQQQEIYAEIHPQTLPHDINQRNRSRAQPQVPLYRKMGRRASEGNALSEREQYFDAPYPSLNGERYPKLNMKAVYKPTYLAEAPQNMYPAAAGCRLSLDVGRRESTSSLTSSTADGSKDSLSSFDSTSTLTGHDTDDSKIIERFRKNFQQKEEFLKMPHEQANVEHALVHREFYGQPKKMDRAMWPPYEAVQQRQESPSRSASNKPNHQNFLRVKNDIDNEREYSQVQNGGGGVALNPPPHKTAKSPKDKNNYALNLDKIHEASMAPTGYDTSEQVNGSQTADEYPYDRYPHIVHQRAKEFESGKPLPEDDPMSNRIDFTRNELARISSKKLVPNVNERAHEYETRAVVEPRRDNSGTSTNSSSSVFKRIQRDSRSLDSSGSNASSSSVHDDLQGGGAKKLSGNVTISSGSKYIHCPPPTEPGKPTDTSGNEAIKQRARSNSTESWVAALGSHNNKQDATTKRISRQDAVSMLERNNARAMDVSGAESMPLYGDTPPLIPVPVERLQIAPSVSVTPAPTRPARPNQLDLGLAGGPVRPTRHLKPPPIEGANATRRSLSPVNPDEKPVVVKRRHKNTNLADDERAMRRESYLKATEGGRVHFDADISDGEMSPQVLRSEHRRWRRPMFLGDIQQLRKLFEDHASSSYGGSASGNSSSSASLDKEKIGESPSDTKEIVKEGLVFCKILEIDGKRSADRSWKQVYAVLRGPKLFLYKDKHHSSPMGSADVVDHSLASGVDMRASTVRVAEEYTKKKNVFRVSSVKPCRSEFLLQTQEYGDWVTILQEQVATTTEAEAKLDPTSSSSQQAVPQANPATMTIQVQGSHLSPQLSKAKNSSARNRSPTGQSPVSKTRKPSHINEPSTSPKTKTWAGRMVKQFSKKIQGANSPSSPTAPEVSTFGVPIDQCLPSLRNPFVPRFVEVCTDIVDERGLQTVGIYRVPGNNASITALTEEINKNFEDISQEDPKWQDVHVVSSLLKSFFRKMPDSLMTGQMYPCFIEADKIDKQDLRMKELRRLIKSLPPHNYHTLKHIIEHLKRVVDKSEANRMEAKNLAIVFGPTIVRGENDNMESMVSNMTNQCKIVETLLTHSDWFFSDSEPVDELVPTSFVSVDTGNQALLMDNISKFEAFNKEKEKNGALFSSIISAAQRKVRKATKATSSSQSKEEVTTPTSPKSFSPQHYASTDLKQSTIIDAKSSIDRPTTVTDFEQKNNLPEYHFNYHSGEAELKTRIEKFKKETEEMLQMSKAKIMINNEDLPRGTLSSSASNVNQNTRLSLNPSDMLTKTRSASNVFARTPNLSEHARNSLNSVDGAAFSVSPLARVNSDGGRNDAGFQQQNTYGPLNAGGAVVLNNNASVMKGASGTFKEYALRRGSSTENVNSSSLDLTGNGNLKKVKYDENDHRMGSLDSLNKLQSTDDDSDLLSHMTKMYDQIKQKHSQSNLLAGDDLPFVDESPEKQHQPPLPPPTDHGANNNSLSDKENDPKANNNDLYKNPSLHKMQYTIKLKEVKYKEDKEKDVDTKNADSVPDNERNISLGKISLNGQRLKRSESLNKPERTVSPLTIKLKRSESLNKTGDKLKRSDSLTKNEKTESNNNKRRELSTIRRKDNPKLKRKNGMPDRSIKRRHTVGGTKDPDKVTLYDNKYEEKATATKENKEKNLRTSSPDLSSTRRERLFLEINVVGPENVVMALRQHWMGARPQSFPETVCKVLESHV